MRPALGLPAFCIIYLFIYYLSLAKYLYWMQYKHVSTVFFQACLYYLGMTGIVWVEVLLGCFVVVTGGFCWGFNFIVYYEYNFCYCNCPNQFFSTARYTLCTFFTSVHGWDKNSLELNIQCFKITELVIEIVISDISVMLLIYFLYAKYYTTESLIFLPRFILKIWWSLFTCLSPPVVI